MGEARIITGDCLETLRTLPAGTAQCCVTSPPYYGLRDYGVEGQIGLEETPDAFVDRLVEVFREVRRVLRDDGTLWLNIGDSYSANAGQRTRGGPPSASSTLAGNGHFGGGPKLRAMPAIESDGYARRGREQRARSAFRGGDVKAKDLIGIPWMLAFALRADGWFLRSDIIWHKPNPMPESVIDRPTSAHEHVFLLSKAERYFYDAEAIAEEATGEAPGNTKPVTRLPGERNGSNANVRGSLHKIGARERRNSRNVWTIASQPFFGAHFATMPRALAERCIKAGSKPGDTILDPFGGAGTTGLLADRLGRNAILCEINPAYAEMASKRLTADAPLLRHPHA